MSDSEDILNTAGHGAEGKPFGKPAGGQLGEDKLMAYLNGTLSPGEQHEVEQWMSEDGMEGDAIEGLKTLGAAETGHTVRQLNRQLDKHLARKKRVRRRGKPDQITWIAILIILLLVVVAYLVIKVIV